MDVVDVLAFILIGLIAYTNLSEGIYGSLIVLLLTVLCGTIAMNFYEPIATFLGERHLPWGGFDRYADGVIFLLLYGGSLWGLRALFEKFLTERVRFPANIDRVGAGAIGTVTGIVAVGALLLACQMMPLNKGFLGYRQKRAVLGISPDATFLHLMHHLSANVLERGPAYEMPEPIDIRDHYWVLRWPPGEESEED